MGANSSRPADYDAPAYGLFITFIALTTIAITARATSRYLQRASLGMDDALAYMAYLLNLANTIALLMSIPKGATNLGKLMASGPKSQQYIAHCLTASSVLYNLTIITAKLSMLLLLRRIFTMTQRWFAIFWWVNFIYILPLWTVTSFTIVIYANVKGLALGNPTINVAIPAVSAANALSDIMLLVLPVRTVLQLKLGKLHKIGIAGLFCLGLITTLVSLARMSTSIYQSTAPLDWNPAYSTYVDLIFSAAETCATVMCICLPVAKPFFSKVGELASRGASEASSLLSLVPRPFSQRSFSQTQSGSRDIETHSQGSLSKRNITRTHTIDVDSIPLKQCPSSNNSTEQGEV